MKTRFLIAASLLALGSTFVHASPTAEQKAAAKEKVAAMTPEEKAAAKEKAKAKWDTMSPEEQATAKKRFKENHPRGARKGEKAEAAASK